MSSELETGSKYQKYKLNESDFLQRGDLVQNEETCGGGRDIAFFIINLAELH